MPEERTSLALDLPGSRALIVGTGRHAEGSRLPDVPAVGRTVPRLKRTLVDRCGMRHVTSRVDPAGPKEFLRLLVDEATAAEDVFLFYYVGHGLIGPGNELYLATQATEDEGIGLAVDALAYATVREALTECPARSIMVVLDCCFSGRAHGSFGTAVADAFELSHVRGSFLLSSASATEQALAPEGETYTAFSGELMRFLREGDSAEPRGLTADGAFRHLARSLPARGLPAPHRRAGDRAGELVLATNPAAASVTVRRSTIAGGSAEPSAETFCPYRGLAPFTAVDSGFFFGRDDLVAEVLTSLVEHQDAGPVAIVGRSGSGKSSLLQAGVLPAIRAGRLRIPGSRTWPQLIVKPGGHPLRVLANRLARGGAVPEGEIHDRVRDAPSQLADIVRDTLRRHAGDRDVPGGRLVLVVDQFEELFTLCADEGERRAFVQAITSAGRATDRTIPPLLVVLGIRADFYGHCMDYPELADALRDAQVPVRPLKPGQLREVIEKPAEAAGLTLEDGLVARLLQDLRLGREDTDQAGETLPLLSYALLATWQQREGTTLTLAGYEATGGIWQAVTRQADKTYEALNPAEQAATRPMLLRLVRLGEGTEDTRRRLDLTEVLTDPPGVQPGAVRAALDAFVAARLVTVADGTAEIAHEALLRAWPLLRQWIKDDRAELLRRQQLADAATAWDRGGREQARLYAGSRLDHAVGRYGDPVQRATLSPLEREFLDASIDTARRQARSRRRRRAGALLAALLIITGGTIAVQSGIYAQREHQAALDSQAEQSSKQLAAEADALRANDPAAALRLSLTAYRSAPTAEARSSLYASYITPYPTLLDQHKGAALGVAYAPNGAVVASAGQDDTVRLWTVAEAFHPAPAAILPVDSGALIAFSPDSGLLAAHTESQLVLWDVRDAAHPSQLAAVPLDRASYDPIRPAIAFAPDGATLATGTGDGTVQLWDVRDPHRPGIAATVAGDAQPVNDVAFGPDGILAVASNTMSAGENGGRVRLWDAHDPHHPAPRAEVTVNSAIALAFSGHVLASAGALGDVHEWDVTDPQHPRDFPGESTGSRDEDLLSVSFRPDGRGFVTAGAAGTVHFWTTGGTDGEVQAMDDVGGPAGFQAVAFGPDGRHLLTGGRDGKVELWSIPAPMPTGSVQDWLNGGTAFSADGKVLVTGDANNRGLGVGLWDVRNPPWSESQSRLPAPWVSGAFLGDGRTLLVRDEEGGLGLWDVSDARHPRAGATLPGGNVAADSSLLLAIASADRDTITLWDIRDIQHPAQVVTIPAGQASDGRSVRDPAQMWFLDPGILGVHHGDDLILWDVRDPLNPIRRGTISRGGSVYTYIRSRHLLAGKGPAGENNTQLWDLSNLDRPIGITDEALNQGHPSELNAVPETLFPVSGTIFAGVAQGSNLIQLWNTADPARPVVVDSLGVGDAPRQMSGSPDGQFLIGQASILLDRQRLWRVSGTDQPRIDDFAALPAGSEVVFRPDGRALATEIPSSSGGRSILSPGNDLFIVWPLGPDPLYQQLCTVIGGAATSDGWQKYLPHQFYRPACT
ncbi:hypothetical protein FNH05_04865 [Amycolatopsis rhizosphaerae]|uniref:Uncharacterized protein n=1 Tax=Amycolatopsis rhizosphaerae TaxID=2053003 RepID=A0A558DGU6_9PSEU|nr:caspase family protein [Amycolatopsis rhizosphaerae]TVT60113.1 hypothetical protein FNH05_04865 [Amycolatopsis rhizosphaerae]